MDTMAPVMFMESMCTLLWRQTIMHNHTQLYSSIIHSLECMFSTLWMY